jgi:hypothetical protein
MFEMRTSASGSEAQFALAMQCRLWRAFRSFPRRHMYAYHPPKAEVSSSHDSRRLSTQSGRDRPLSLIGALSVGERWRRDLS